MHPVMGRDSSLVTGWTLRGSNPVWGEIFRTRLDRPWGPPSLLYNVTRFLPGSKMAEAWRWPHTPSSAEVKERVELTSTHPLDLRGLFWVIFTFTLYLA
jgi:hypothetical protein